MKKQEKESTVQERRRVRDITGKPWGREEIQSDKTDEKSKFKPLYPVSDP